MTELLGICGPAVVALGAYWMTRRIRKRIEAEQYKLHRELMILELERKYGRRELPPNFEEQVKAAFERRAIPPREPGPRRKRLPLKPPKAPKDFPKARLLEKRRRPGV